MPNDNYPVDATITITGRPIVTFELHGVMSMNTFHNLHFRAKGTTNKLWRDRGYDMGLDAVGWKDTPLIIRRAFVLAKVWTPHEGIMDIHNLHLKPFYDGLSDAGVWLDDEWSSLPVTMSLWAGSGTELSAPRKKRGKKRVRLSKTILEVYELNFVKVCGFYQRLPKGRRRL